jgi:hypothetical protein
MVTAALPKETTHESLSLVFFASSKAPDASFSLEEFDFEAHNDDTSIIAPTRVRDRKSTISVHEAPLVLPFEI